MTTDSQPHGNTEAAAERGMGVPPMCRGAVPPPEDRGRDARDTQDAHATPLARREWFGWVARGAAAAGLAAVGAYLGLRNLGRTKEDPCIRTGICSGCERAEDCGLPQAMLFRDRPAGAGGATGAGEASKAGAPGAGDAATRLEGPARG